MADSPDPNESRVALLMAIIWVAAGISTTLAACRLFTRLLILKAAGKDDIALVLSVVSLSNPMVHSMSLRIHIDDEPYSSDNVHNIDTLWNRKTSRNPFTSGCRESHQVRRRFESLRHHGLLYSQSRRSASPCSLDGAKPPKKMALVCRHWYHDGSWHILCYLFICAM